MGGAANRAIRRGYRERESRFRKRTLDLPEGTSLRDLIGQLDIAEDQVSLPAINGRHAELEVQLAPNDVVSVLPAIAGG